MTDRVLTDEEVDRYERTAPKLDTCNSSYPAVVALSASHRLLQKQVAGLEQQLEVQRLNLKWFDRQLQETERDD